MNGNTSDILSYERPALTADCVLLRLRPDAPANNPVLQVRLVRRPNAPELGKLALIGAFVPVDERVDDVLVRCVSSKAGIDKFYFEQLYTFDTPGRDERWRVISVAHIGIVPPGAPERASDGAEWYDIDTKNRILYSSDRETECSFDDLAFDHAEILDMTLSRLASKVLWTDVAFRFIPETFTISQLKGVLELLAGKPVNNVKRDFGKMLEPAVAPEMDAQAVLDGLEASPTVQPKRPAHRPASYYRFIGDAPA